MRFFPNIDQLFNGIQRALKASVFVIMGFFLYIFVVSVLSCFFFKDISPQHFGNPISSLYTSFKIFTIEGWYEVPDAIAEETSLTVAFFTKLYFAAILLTGGIFGLSLVNSIFVDAMVSDNNDELEKKVASLERKIDILLENSHRNTNHQKELEEAEEL
jgi:voltage-gated sodium channel